MKEKQDPQNQLQRLLPWGAGAGFAVGQMGLTTSCTVITQGQCVGCAGCVVALVSLVSWSLLKDDSEDGQEASNREASKKRSKENNKKMSQAVIK